jgi:hypothetical protein
MPILQGKNRFHRKDAEFLLPDENPETKRNADQTRCISMFVDLEDAAGGERRNSPLTLVGMVMPLDDTAVTQRHSSPRKDSISSVMAFDGERYRRSPGLLPE